jgi:hypothetical protein
MAFKRLDPEDFLVSAQAVSSTTWTGFSPTLTEFYLNNNQTGSESGKYYWSVYNEDPNIPQNNAEVQFDIAFADRIGRGALAFNANESNERTPSQTIYGQYRSLILEDENASFKFGDVQQNYFYVLNVSRARYKEKLLPGSFNIKLKNGSSELTLTDNSKDITIPDYYGTQRAFQIISGSNGNAWNATQGGKGYTTNSGSYGWFLPDISTVLLNGAALDLNTIEGLNLQTNLGVNTDGRNNLKIYNAISSSGEFRLNTEETLTSDFIFVRARNSEFNYSENPTFVSGSTGEVIYNYFINNPQVYPTTIGLYNDSNELLAVAKLSRPLLKDFTKELLVRVRLDF